MDIHPQYVINEYTFLEKIGAGAFSQVYKVFSERFKRTFTAKVLVVDPLRAERTRRAYEAEIESLVRLNHANIIRLCEYFYHNDAEFLILEYCAKGTLQEELACTQGVGMRIERFLVVARQMVDALDFCHARAVAPRDVKLVNIFIDEHNRAKLADFGIAVPPGGRVGGQVFGTLAYIAPELFVKDQRSPYKPDIWAMGVAFVLLLDGKVPWPVEQGEKAVRRAIFTGKYEVNRQLPAEIQALIARMIVVDPDARASATELKQMPWYQLPTEPYVQPTDHVDLKLQRLSSLGPLRASQRRTYARTRCLVLCRTFSEMGEPVLVSRK
jgi:serine/threonine protein kinase